MEAAGFSYMSVATYPSTRRNIPEDFNLHQHRCENLQSDTILLISENPKYQAVRSATAIRGNH
jgi:hypothetical protein